MTNGTTQTISVMTWNVKELQNVKRLMLTNRFTTNAIIEIFNTCEISSQDYYMYETLATQGPACRPSGGITCLIKPHLTLARIIHSTPNLIAVNSKYLVIIGIYFQPEHTASIL